jgi:hypothetical protein
MNAVGYGIVTSSMLSTHYSCRLWNVADGDDGVMDRLELETHVRSGDYWSTLATRLDTICQLLPDTNDAERVNLQRIIDELLYIERKYTLTKRN